MKTMTITYHASNNNGSFFQAYALQQTLKNELQIENQIIDFRGKELLDNYKLFRPIHSLNNLLKDIYTFLHLSNLKVRQTRFETLRSHYLVMTNRISSMNELEALKTQCDVFIAGSDQIWNTTAPDFNPAFFLPGIKNKVGYGISFGSTTSQAPILDYECYIKEFCGISTRERSGKEHLKKMYGNTVSVVADPTLLLQKEDYAIFEQENAIHLGKYIFYYSMKYSKSALHEISELSKKLGIPVVTVFTNYHTCYCTRYGIRIYYDAGPIEFLNLLTHATLVASDSYHGIVFSVLFHKEFIYLNDKKEDERIDDLLRILGIYEQAIVHQGTCTKASVMDWSLIDGKLKELKQYSLSYLRNELTLEK